MSLRVANPCRRRGVALVITLILLSVILVITFALLAVSRRERASVTTGQHLIDAEYMANAAMERAKATLAAQILGRTNLMAGGFGRPIYAPEISPDPSSLTALDARVGGDLLVSVAASTNWPNTAQYLQSLTNLQFDAAPPVFVRTNRIDPLAPLESRHFIDLNRNGLFESNGFFSLFDATEQKIGTNQVFHSGDPEWIGVLAQPGWNHSPTNRFIGRYAFMVLPAGRTLDINAIHNSARENADLTTQTEGYGRNQGAGTYELNLAAFLADLNTNKWFRGAGYLYDLAKPWGNGNGVGAGRGSGTGFDHARGILRHRYDGRRSNLPTLGQWLGSSVLGTRLGDSFQNDFLDSYADDADDAITNRLIHLPTLENDPASTDLNARWPGVDNPVRFVSYEDLVKPRETNESVVLDPLKRPYYAEFTRALRNASAGPGTYNRYTFYRLLSQIGTDTGTGPEGRLNLNYVNIEGTNVTDMVPWEPTNFFVTVANRLIHRTISDAALTNVDINRERYSTNFAHFYDITNGLVPIFFNSNKQQFVYLEQLGTNIVRNLGATNIPVYPTNFYNSAIHRMLQLAANLYEPSTNRLAPFRDTVPYNHAGYLPTVYRPVFARKGVTVVVQGYVEDDGSGLELFPWYTIPELYAKMVQNGQTETASVNVYGVPPIVAARKGMPSLNEISLTTGIRLARRLEVTKEDPKDDLLTKPYKLRESFSFASANRFGIELLNSYTSTYPRKVNVKVHGRLVTTFLNDNEPFLRVTNLIGFQTNFPAGTWKGGDLSSKAGIRIATLTNLLAIPHAILIPDNSNPGKFRVSLRYDTNNIFTGPYDVFVTPKLACRTVMDIGCLMFDAEAKSTTTTGRIIDAASFGGTSAYFDINELLQGSKDSAGVSGAFTSTKRRIWDNTPAGGNRSAGVSNQVNVSWNGNNIPDINSVWSPMFINLQARSNAILKYAFFHRGLIETNRVQAPFTADTDLFQNYRWQANDPLLHHIPDQMPVRIQTLEFRYGNANNAPTNLLGTLALVASTNLWDPGTPNLQSHKPWPSSTTPILLERFDPYLRDPMVRSPDDWEFPTNRLPNLGSIGSIHRGTPWQTVFLKSASPLPGPQMEAKWITHMGTDVFKQTVIDDPSKHIFTNVWFSFPTNDWSLVDMFTVGASDSAGAGMIGVNQGGLAAWSAVLSGVVVLTNHVELQEAEIRFNQQNPKLPPSLGFAAIQPALASDPSSPTNSPLVRIVNGINLVRSQMHSGLFGSVGQILAVPELTMTSPFLRQNQAKLSMMAISEQAYEQIPRQILSLIRSDEPRFVIYAFGQALQPAKDSLIKDPTAPEQYFNLCTNYQVTAETATKAVIRFVDIGDKTKSPKMILRPVVESFEQLPPDGL